MRTFFWSKSTSMWVIKNEINMNFSCLWGIFFSWRKFFGFSHSLGPQRTLVTWKWEAITANKRRSESVDESKKQVYYRLTMCFPFSANTPWNRVRLILGFSIRAVSRAMKSSGPANDNDCSSGNSLKPEGQIACGLLPVFLGRHWNSLLHEKHAGDLDPGSWRGNKRFRTLFGGGGA